MQDQFLAPPVNNCANFEKKSKRQRELLELFEHILIYQSSGVMMDTSGMRPSQFFSNPSGHLGIDNICNTAYEPIKMCKILMKHFKNPRDIRIIGYPDINWRANPDSPGPLKNYINYATARLGHYVQAKVELSKACYEFYKEKKAKGRRRKDEVEEEEPQEYHLQIMFGWPLAVSHNWYCEFLSSLCPINMRFRRLRNIDIYESLSCWSINLGSIPPLALCLLRGCLLYDPSSTESTSLHEILLRELNVDWNMAEIRRRFYSSDSKMHSHIAMPGCLLGNYKDIMSHIQKSMTLGSMSPQQAVRLLRKAIDYGVSVFEGMVESNAFLSMRVTQALDIINRVSIETKAGRLKLFESLETYQKYLINMQEVDPVLFNPYDRARRTILASLIDLNNFENLNSQNMQLKLELFISMIAHTLGTHNESLKAFGQGIELAPCCGTLSEFVHVGNKKARLRHVACENSAGKDYTCNFVTKIFDHLCEMFSISESLQGLKVLSRFTPVSVESATCISTEDGEIISTPDKSLNFGFFISTESRGNKEAEQDIVIRLIYKRGGNQEQACLTTNEDKNKNRRLVIKTPISRLMLCARCTNEPLHSSSENEQMNTIGAVALLLEPGSSPFMPVNREGDLSDIQQAQHETRDIPLNGHTAKFAPLMVALSHVYCTTYLCLTNGIGVYQAEINPAVSSTIDWLFLIMKKYVDTLLHSRCRGNSIMRLKCVYENRAAAFTAWCKMTQYLLGCRDREKAVSKAISNFQCDAVALTDVVGMLWSMMRRCIHWGPVLYSVCFIRECRMPIVPIKDLIELLRAENVPDQGTELRRHYDSVHRWLVDNVVRHRFCPADLFAYSNEYCEYISSSGLADGTMEDNGVLRVNQTVNGWKESDKRSVQEALSSVVFERYGDELESACSVTRETMGCAIDDMLDGFSVELQKLLGVSMFDMERHITFFGLKDRLSFRCFEREAKHPFMIKSAWKKVNHSFHLPLPEL